MSLPPRYAVITPARDEVANLERLGECLAAQTRVPDVWMIVDNGSTDGTPDLATELAAGYPWVALTSAPGETGQVRGAPVVRAFHAGVAQLDGDVAFVAKLDADITLGPDYLARLLDQFEQDSSLGIASGNAWELENGVWRERFPTKPNVWGAARMYRRACLERLLPLDERMGWDAIDVVRANVEGWSTRVIPELSFRHHRVEASRDGAGWNRWVKQGKIAHYLGYRPSYLLLRTLHHARRERSAAAMLWGFAAAVAQRAPRCSDERVIDHVRRQQRFRELPLRVSEALGRRLRPRVTPPLPPR